MSSVFRSSHCHFKLAFKFPINQELGLSKLRGMQTPEAELAEMSNISGIDLRDVKERDKAVMNNSTLRVDFSNIIF